MTKQERAIKARAHYEDIKTRLAANTKLSIERTYVYSPDSFTQHESGNQKPAFTLTDMDLTMVEQQFLTMPVIKVLVVSSQKVVLRKKRLCVIYPILLAFDGTYYAWNRQRLNKALYLRGPEFPNGAQIPECE